MKLQTKTNQSQNNEITISYNIKGIKREKKRNKVKTFKSKFEA